MPELKLIFFQDEDGSVPLIEWLDSLPRKARAKCISRLQRLALLGHELRRPEADFLRDGIHELRAAYAESIIECSISFTGEWRQSFLMA